MNKPLHLSRKAQLALLTTIANLLAVLLCEYSDRPDLQPLLVASMTTIGAVLIGAFGMQDSGKEAAHAEALADRVIDEMAPYPDEGDEL